MTFVKPSRSFLPFAKSVFFCHGTPTYLFYNILLVFFLFGTGNDLPAQDTGPIETTPLGWKITTGSGTLFITPYSTQIARVAFIPEGSTGTDSSDAVIMKPERNIKRWQQQLPGRVTVLHTEWLKFVVTEQPFNLSIVAGHDTLISRAAMFGAEQGESSVSTSLAGSEQIYGAGERAVPLNRRGYEMPLYNRPNYGYGVGVTSLNYSVPVVVSSKKYAMLWDNPQKGLVDIGKTSPGKLTWKAIGGEARYFIMAAGNYPELMSLYTELTGRQSLPPRWALGNLQSRMAYRNQAETDSIVSLMIEKDFPIDAIILDFYWFGDSIKGYLGNLDWYRPAWPAPEKMIQDFMQKGVKTILITEPYIIDSLKNYKDALAHNIFVTDSTGKTYLDTNFYFGHGSLIDIFKPEARQWFWEHYQKQIEKGIAGWWGDLGEPESHPSDIYHVNGKADEVHNIYGHYWDKMLFEKYARYYPDRRLFHLQRSGFAGSQRYSAYPWTGDVGRSWSGLQAQLPVLLSMSMNGLGYIHSDAGGFAMGEKDDELYTRWLQFAVFTPILRPHGSGIPSEPVYFNDTTQKIVRRFMNLRYTLLPYNYTLAWQNATKGYPLMRPLYYSFPDDTAAVNVNDQYLWGDNMLIAPVIAPGQRIRSVYLPVGGWYDYFSGEYYPGGKREDIPVSPDRIPVFVRSGAFIPETRPVRSTDFYHSDNFTVRYYPSGKSEFVQYEDDGADNHALANGQYELIRYTGKSDHGKITVHISHEGSWKGMPQQRSMTLEIKTDQAPASVVLNKKALTDQPDESTGYQVEDGFVKIRFIWKGEPVEVVVK